MRVFKFFHWCDSAVSKIKIRKDREAVKYELYGHMEDRYDSFAELGLSEDEAAQKTIEVMGSAEELADQLEKIYNPFWLYMLWASRVALIVLLIIALPTVQKHWPKNSTQQPTEPSAAYDHPFLSFDPYVDETCRTDTLFLKQIMCFEPETSGRIFPYPATISKAALWHNISYPQWSNDECEEFDSLYIQIELAPGKTTVFPGVNDVYAVDSLGNYYYSTIESAISYYFATSGGHLPHVYTCCAAYKADRSARYHVHGSTYELVLSNFVSHDAEWIELRYDRDGKDYTMRINLPGGVSNG